MATRDTPTHLADASPVVLGEERGERRTSTLDSSFLAHHLGGRRRFAVVPG